MMNITFGRTVPPANAEFVKTSESSARVGDTLAARPKHASARVSSLLVMRMIFLRLLRNGVGRLDAGHDVLAARTDDGHGALRVAAQVQLEIGVGDLGV